MTSQLPMVGSLRIVNTLVRRDDILLRSCKLPCLLPIFTTGPWANRIAPDAKAKPTTLFRMMFLTLILLFQSC